LVIDPCRIEFRICSMHSPFRIVTPFQQRALRHGLPKEVAPASAKDDVAANTEAYVLQLLYREP